MKDFVKILCIGTIDGNRIFVKIEYKGGRLSFSGVEGPTKNGNCRGSCGQILMGYKEYDPRGYKSLRDINPADGWDADSIKRFADVWDRWHLNYMRAGTASQMEYLRSNPVSATYPESHYKKASAALASAGINPDLTTNPPYSYGSAWLREEVPSEVLAYLSNLPDSPITPNWV